MSEFIQLTFYENPRQKIFIRVSEITAVWEKRFSGTIKVIVKTDTEFVVFEDYKTVLKKMFAKREWNYK